MIRIWRVMGHLRRWLVVLQAPIKESSCLVLDRERMAGMGLVSRAYDKLPDWAKIVLGIVGIAAIVYGLYTEGPIFLLKVLLKPVP
jgi:hypothetical protein